MIVIERIPNFCDFNREPKKWKNIEDFLSDKFLSTWFGIVKNIIDIDLFKMEWSDDNEFELILKTKERRVHIAFVYLQKGDDKNLILEKIKSKQKTN